MPKHTTGRVLALASGAAFVAGSLIILIGDALLTPSTWTRYQVLTLIMVGGTLAAGHLAGDAMRARAIVATLAFGLLFLAGTALVVIQSVGRQAETADTRTIAVSEHNEQVARLRGDQTGLRRQIEWSRPGVLEECEGAPTPLPPKGWPACRRKRAALLALEQGLERIEAALAKLGPQEPVAPKAERVAAVLALAGLDRAKARAGFELVEPFLWTLFFELGAIISIGFAFRHARNGTQEARGAATIAGATQGGENHFRPSAANVGPEIEPPTDPAPPSGPAPGNGSGPGSGNRCRKRQPATVSGNVVRLPPRHPVIVALEQAGGSVASNRDLASLMGVTPGESSKRCREVAAAIDTTRVGKAVRIKLRRA